MLHHRARRLRIEAGDGLVGQHEQRVLHKRPSDAHALLLPARQLVGAYIGEVGKAHLAKDLERAALLILAEQAEHARNGGFVAQTPLQHVLDGRGAMHEVVVLEHHGDATAARAQRAAVHPRHVVAVEDHRPFRGVDEAVHAAQERGLARARRADDADELAPAHLEAHAVERPRAAVVAFRQPAQLKQHVAPCSIHYSAPFRLRTGSYHASSTSTKRVFSDAFSKMPLAFSSSGSTKICGLFATSSEQK